MSLANSDKKVNSNYDKDHMVVYLVLLFMMMEDIFSDMTVNIFKDYSVMIPMILLLSCSVTSVDPEAGGTVQRLMSQKEFLIQPGLSFINSSNLAGISRVTLDDIHNFTIASSSISTTINLVNWSRWLLGYPVYYFKYGHFKNGKFAFCKSRRKIMVR